MLNLTTSRFGLMTICLAGSVFLSGVVSGQEQSVLDRSQVDPSMNEPGNSLLKPSVEAIEAPRPDDSESRPVVDEDIQQLTRGPLHEAFAEVQTEEVAPNSIIARQPPEPINELPPQYKPDGENVEWIPGYWAWDEEQEDFLWISGIWRDLPPGQRWVPGYWESVNGGYRWANGFWMSHDVEEIEYLPPPPASLESGPSTPSPSDQHFYSPGTWIYQTNQYVWQPGCWMPRLDEWVWVPPAYVWTPRGCVFRAGYWDRLFDCRGLVFAPICYRRPVYVEVGYYYTPTCVIRTNFDLLPHLFVRRNCRSYYFGDWYDDRYLDRGFCAWSQIAVRPQFRRCYDPFFTYYNHSAIRYNDVNLIRWVQTQNDFCLHNIDRRPARSFNVQINIQNQHNHFESTVIQNQPVVLADTLDRRVQSNHRHGGQPETFKQLADQDRREIQKRTDPIRTLARNRQELEKTQPTAGGNPQLPSVSNDPVLRASESRKSKLSLPKVERQQLEAAERAAAELKRQQERQTRAAQLAERRQANSANRGDNASSDPGKARESAPESRGVAGRKPTNPAGTLPPSSPSSEDKQVLRRQENDRRLQELKAAQAAREAQRNQELQLKGQQREQERAQRDLQRNTPRLPAGKDPANDPNLIRDQKRDQERVNRELMEQQQAQQRIQDQQRRASELAAQKAAQQAAQQQRESQLAARRQQEAQERSLRQQREAQDRAARQQQDQFRDQQRKIQEDAARQQRNAERQQQRDQRKKKDK